MSQKIRNPLTGRMVKIDGRIGKKIVKAAAVVAPALPDLPMGVISIIFEKMESSGDFGTMAAFKQANKLFNNSLTMPDADKVSWKLFRQFLTRVDAASPENWGVMLGKQELDVYDFQGEVKITKAFVNKKEGVCYDFRIITYTSKMFTIRAPTLDAMLDAVESSTRPVVSRVSKQTLWANALAMGVETLKHRLCAVIMRDEYFGHLAHSLLQQKIQFEGVDEEFFGCGSYRG